MIEEYCSDSNSNSWDFQSFKTEILNIFSLELKDDIQNTSRDSLRDTIIKGTSEIISFKKDNVNEKLFDHFQRFIILRTIDKEWQDHLYMMDQLREGISLRAYGQKNPLVEYKHEGFAMFESMMKSTNAETLKRIFRTDISNLSNSTPMKHTAQPKNIQTKSDSNILKNINSPSSNTSSSSPPDFLNPRSAPMAPGQKKQPVTADKKIGRNDKVTIKKGSKTKTIKYKKAEQFIDDGWHIIDPS